MKVSETSLKGICLIEGRSFSDDRGFFRELWNEPAYEAQGITGPFVQDNVSVSKKHVLRGLHYQQPHAQGKLVSVIEGEILDVAVDIRVGSPTFGNHVAYVLSQTNHRQLFISTGFAHGFLVLSERAVVTYKCTDVYYPDCEAGILWSDPDIGIDWPNMQPILAARDSACPRLRDVSPDRLPHF